MLILLTTRASYRFDDMLVGDGTAPEWVKNWQGRFTMTVKIVSETDLRRA